MPRLLDQVREVTRRLHYSIRTEDAHVAWTKRFVLFHGQRHPLEMGEPEVLAFLNHLAVRRNGDAQGDILKYHGNLQPAVSLFAQIVHSTPILRNVPFSLFQTIANHESPKTTQLHDRIGDQMTLDELERIVIYLNSRIFLLKLSASAPNNVTFTNESAIRALNLTTTESSLDSMYAIFRTLIQYLLSFKKCLAYRFSSLKYDLACIISLASVNLKGILSSCG